MRTRWKCGFFIPAMCLVILTMLTAMSFAATDQDRVMQDNCAIALNGAVITTKAPATMLAGADRAVAKMYAKQAAACLVKKDIAEVTPGEDIQQMKMAAEVIDRAVKAQNAYHPSMQSLVLAGEKYYDQCKMYTAANAISNTIVAIADKGAYQAISTGLIPKETLNTLAYVDPPLKTCQFAAVTSGCGQTPAEMACAGIYPVPSPVIISSA